MTPPLLSGPVGPSCPVFPSLPGDPGGPCTPGRPSLPRRSSTNTLVPLFSDTFRLVCPTDPVRNGIVCHVNRFSCVLAEDRASNHTDLSLFLRIYTYK